MSLAEDIAEDEEHLRQRYYREPCTLDELAEEYDTSVYMIRKAFDIAGIERRSPGGGSLDPTLAEKIAEENDLREMYEEDYMEASEIAENLDVSSDTVYRALEEAGIEARSMTQRIADNEPLEELYIGQHLSTYKIAERLGVDDETIRLALEKADVERRPEGWQIYPPTTEPPYEDLDLAYLGGLLDGEGSLGVRSSPNSFDGEAPNMWIKMGAEETIKWLRDTFGGTVTTEERNQPNYTDMWKWNLHRTRDIWIVLQAVKPHLKHKDGEAEEVLEYIYRHHSDYLPEDELEGYRMSNS